MKFFDICPSFPVFRCALCSLRELWVLNYWGLAPVHRHYMYVNRCTAYHVRSHRCALRSLRELRVLNDWVLAPLHILSYTHSSLHSAFACARMGASRLFCSLGSEILGPCFVAYSARYTFIVTHSSLIFSKTRTDIEKQILKIFLNPFSLRNFLGRGSGGQAGLAGVALPLHDQP